MSALGEDAADFRDAGAPSSSCGLIGCRRLPCPYKGEASYYSIPTGGERSTNAVWTYEAPFPAMAAIKDHVAFYSDRVDEIR